MKEFLKTGKLLIGMQGIQIEKINSWIPFHTGETIASITFISENILSQLYWNISQ